MKFKIQNVFKHFNTINKHRLQVFIEMSKCGKPIQGLLHDISKYSPTEFLEGVKYYQGDRSPINACKEDIGYSKAWFHHRGRNKHHSQYWCDISFGEIKPCDIPWKYLLELICDGISAGKIYQGKDWNDSVPYVYFTTVDNKSFYSDKTKNKLKIYYMLIDKYGWNKIAKHIKKYGDFINNYYAMKSLDTKFSIIWEEEYGDSEI